MTSGSLKIPKRIACLELRLRRSITYEFWILTLRISSKNAPKGCFDQTNRYFHIYGGRGISICRRWNNFRLFLKDMGEKPEGMSLDRINNNKGYGPRNCRWATPAEQSRNSRRNRFLKCNGKRQCLRDWEIELGLSRGAIHRRLKSGWPVKLSITTRSLR